MYGMYPLKYVKSANENTARVKDTLFIDLRIIKQVSVIFITQVFLKAKAGTMQDALGRQTQ